MYVCIDSDGELEIIIEDEVPSYSQIDSIMERRPYPNNQKGIL